MPSGQPPNGYNPVPGYQPSVVPYQPTAPIRPDGFPGGATPPMTASLGNPTVAAPAYGPLYQSGQQRAPCSSPQPYLCRPYPPGGGVSGPPPAPVQLCEWALILARVGNDVILASDVLASVDDILSHGNGRIPPEKLAEQRAMWVQEVTAGIHELSAHYNDPDPAKAMSQSHRGLINQLLQEQVKLKIIFQDFLKTVPKERLPEIQENIMRHFEETQLKLLMKRENAVSLADLETALRAKGSSLEREKRVFMEQVVAQQWVEQKVKPEGGKDKPEEEVTHEEMLKWYQAHLKDFEEPAKARWEELMVSFAKHPNRDQAYAALAQMGNQVIHGVPLADVAKATSEGATSRKGGQQDWSHKGSLSSEILDQAIFNLPVGQLSQILESNDGFHIVRVVERKELTRKSFEDVQKQIKDKIKQERLDQRKKEFADELKKKYPVWTIFDNSAQEPKNPDDEDRYSRR